MKQACIIIPMYGKAEYTRRCVDTVIANCGLLNYDILVVDDGSPYKYEDDRVIHLRLPTNTGYTNATNQGILWANDRYKYLCLLNNDTELLPDCLSHLYDEMEKDSQIAIASSVRLHPKDDGYDVELYGLDLLRGFQCVTRLENLKDEVINCNWVPLPCALVRTDVIRELGILDKRMRTHSSDLDYCLRVKLAGYKIIVVTDSRCVHFHEVTTKEHGITPEKDQKVLLEKLAGLGYAQLMKVLPLDAESKTFGKLDFTVYQK